MSGMCLGRFSTVEEALVSCVAFDLGLGDCWLFWALLVCCYKTLGYGVLQPKVLVTLQYTG